MAPVKGLSCSFCMKGERNAKKLFAGPSVYICDECVSLCVGIMQGAIPYPPREDTVTAAIPIEAHRFAADARRLLDDILAGHWSQEAEIAIAKEYLRRVRLGRQVIEKRLEELSREEEALLAKLGFSE